VWRCGWGRAATLRFGELMLGRVLVLVFIRDPHPLFVLKGVREHIQGWVPGE